MPVNSDGAGAPTRDQPRAADPGFVVPSPFVDETSTIAVQAVAPTPPPAPAPPLARPIVQPAAPSMPVQMTRAPAFAPPDPRTAPPPPRVAPRRPSSARAWTIAAFVVWSGVLVVSVAWLIAATQSDPPLASPAATSAPAKAAPPVVRAPDGVPSDQDRDDEARADDDRGDDQDRDKAREKLEKERRKWESKGRKHKRND